MDKLQARPLLVTCDRACEVSWRLVEGDGSWHSVTSPDGLRFGLDLPFEEVEVQARDTRQWFFLWSDRQRVGNTRALVQLQLKRSLRSERVLPLLVFLGGLPVWWLVLRRAWSERNSRRQLHQTLAGYVGPDILREMLANPVTSLGSLNQRCEVTILFSDINGFSTYSEQESPEVVAAWLNEHYREMAHVIFQHQGTIVRFIGDQFMVLFGSPKPIERPEEAAVRTALAMQRRLRHLSQLGKPGFYEVKIGVHCGSILLAVIGDELKRDYTAIGDEANVAARIQDLCKQAGVSLLVSREVFERVGPVDGLHFRQMGNWPVKGRSQEVEVFTVTDSPEPPRSSAK